MQINRNSGKLQKIANLKDEEAVKMNVCFWSVIFVAFQFILAEIVLRNLSADKRIIQNKEFPWVIRALCGIPGSYISLLMFSYISQDAHFSQLLLILPIVAPTVCMFIGIIIHQNERYKPLKVRNISQ
ncbi:hypothetical protein COT12_01810 [Candidatus Berkelbacteria bacterium CG08_land_8_20_14_0_20_39_8]|uniref:Uncharacterized protein n=1 Tax=Candidatus Berkelbacteria bacterium CG08_land_8_20_14_0_20_39_8 TaxID=1974511 RepID=A0A2M6YC68_9BACT|nr:MAG: hypothetical protein COT12_01810 [Candidatus Berkelbacteria bacterium CG08_land_8_20_14_0_20_39_8]